MTTHKKRWLPSRPGKVFQINSTEGRLTPDKRIQFITRADAQRLGCGQLPIPSQNELLVDVKTDKQLAAVMCAISRIGQQSNTAFQQQLEIWMEDKGWDPADDPGSLCKPYPKKREPICHCPVPQKNRLGGIRPRMELKSMHCRCAVCLKVIGPGCKRREVTHLRGLLKRLGNHPQIVDITLTQAGTTPLFAKDLLGHQQLWTWPNSPCTQLTHK